MSMKYDYKALFLSKEKHGKILHLIVTGKLEKEDYDECVPIVEKQIEEHAPIRLFMELRDFKGWTAGAAWEDCKVAYKHLGNDVERIAMVGDRTWEQGMAIFVNPFTKTKIRYFDVKNCQEAEKWIQEDCR